ncbi:MAG TPA: hypothetical protein VN651_14215 [Gemmatimonadaceae bacterium]|nr:hypothetical protein [Gemmatimonadaceae bacterium]
MEARLNAHSKTTVAALVTLALGLAACSDARDPVSPMPKAREPGTAVSRVVRASSPSIDLLSFEIRSTSLPSTFLYDIPLTNGGTEASLTIPAGKAYSITVRAYDRYGTQTHVGGVSLESVIAGTNPGFEIALKPLSDSVEAAKIAVGIVGETRLPTGGRIVIKEPQSVEQGDAVPLAAEVVASDGSIIPLEPGDLHWAVSDPSGGMVNADPAQPRIAHLTSNLPREINVVVAYHNYQSIASLTVLANAFTKISAAANYTCGLRYNGALSCWGENSPNQLLGASDAELEASGVGVPCTGDSNQICVTSPLHIAVGKFFTDLSTSATHACAIEKGTAITYCWGNNSGGLLGVSSSAALVPPTSLASSIQFQQISAGATHTCGISNGNGYCWGDNNEGELGNGFMTWMTNGGGSSTPLQLPGSGWTQISAANEFTCGIISSVAKCWGNDKYLLGAGWQATHQSPDTVDRTYAPAIPSQLGIASSASRMCAIMPAGGPNPGAWCWGYDVSDPNSSSLGRSYFPIQLAGASVFTQMANGTNQSCGLDGSGNALCWGSNVYGATGVRNGGYTATVTPVAAGNLTFRSIVSGSDHVCTIASTGYVYCWGSNEYGQLGDSDQQLVGIPTPTLVWGSAQ